MLSLILPPIGIALCLGFLLRLFWKKRGVIREYAGRRNVVLPQAIIPPKEEGIDRDGKEVKKVGMGTLLFRMAQVLLVWVGRLIAKPFQRIFRNDAGIPSFFREEMPETKGVSAVFEEKNVREEGDRNRKGVADVHNREKNKYFGGRPMISDEIALPQKQQQKDEYEQVLIERIALNPKDIEAYERLGDYYMESGSMNDAKECFKQVLRLSPLSRRARIRMRRVEKSLSGR